MIIFVYNLATYKKSFALYEDYIVTNNILIIGKTTFVTNALPQLHINARI